MPQYLVLSMNLAPTRVAALSLIKTGGIVVNGAAIVDFKLFMKPGDSFQLMPKL